MSTNIANFVKVWEPLPPRKINGMELPSSQALALDTRAHHTLFTGTRGPGKTVTQLMRFRRRVGMGYGSYWRGVIFGREYKALRDIITQSKRLFSKFNDGARYYESNGKLGWKWPTGEELLFDIIKNEQEYNDKFHGQEFPFIGWNELCQWGTSECYDLMMSCNRSSWTIDKDSPRDENGKPTMKDDIPLEVFSTTNSRGPGHAWVKSRFIDVARYGVIVKTEIPNVFNPQTQEYEIVIRTQVAIFGSFKENIHLDKIYIAGLIQACESDENKRKSWLEGDWDVVSGGAFDDLWRKAIHVIPRFAIPDNWHIDRAFDWGSTHPFSVGWWAVANGETVNLLSGKTFTPRRGSLIQIAEWYGTAKIGTNKGLKLGSDVIAQGVIDREVKLMRERWIPYQPWPGPADNQIGNVTDMKNETPKKSMESLGVRWEESNKDKGTRKIGLQLMRDRFSAALIGEGPGIYFMENCVASIATIPVLERDPDDLDDIDTTSEDHPYDMTRYRVLAGTSVPIKELRINWVN